MSPENINKAEQIISRIIFQKGDPADELDNIVSDYSDDKFNDDLNCLKEILREERLEKRVLNDAEKLGLQIQKMIDGIRAAGGNMELIKYLAVTADEKILVVDGKLSKEQEESLIEYLMHIREAKGNA